MEIWNSKNLKIFVRVSCRAFFWSFCCRLSSGFGGLITPDNTRLLLQLAAERVEGAGRVFEAWLLIGLFGGQKPNFCWVVQTNHSAFFLGMGGVMGETKRTDQNGQPINQSINCSRT